MSDSRLEPMTALQQEIFDYLLVHSWSSAMREYNITSRGTMKTLIMRSAMGYSWYPGHTGGAPPYLNAAKEERLAHLIDDLCREQESPSRYEVANLALSLRQEMLLEAHSALTKRRCVILASKLETRALAPSPSWLNGFCARHGLQTTVARFVERERTLSCNRAVVLEYWLRFLPLFNRDPRLIFGADETDMKPGSRFKVVAPVNMPGLTHDEVAPKHITAMYAHSAGGVAVPPFILLSGLAKLPSDLAGLETNGPDVAWYGTSEKGYMTEKTFYAWAFMFVTWLTSYRATVLPASLQKSNILLVIDGCLAHGAPEAMHLFAKHNVTVLVLPAHTSHLLQPFDVVLAAPLKSSFRHFVSEEKSKFRGAALTKAAKTRVTLVRAFIRSWRTVATPEACARSFEAVGIFPLSPFIVLNSPFVTDSKTVQADNQLNMKILTDAQVLRNLDSSPRRERFPEMQAPANVGEYEQLLNFFRGQRNGALLSQPTALFWFDATGRWFVVRSCDCPPVPPVRPEVVLAMIKKLTVSCEEDGEQLLSFNREQDETARQLSADVVRTAALELSKGIALKLAADRVTTLGPIIADRNTGEITNWIGENITESDIGLATKETIMQNVHHCSHIALNEALRILAEGQTGAEP